MGERFYGTTRLIASVGGPLGTSGRDLGDVDPCAAASEHGLELFDALELVTQQEQMSALLARRLRRRSRAGRSRPGG